MESNANGTSFSNMGFGESNAPKPGEQANKNIFGGFGLATSSSNAQVQQKSPFGTGILKNPTFTLSSQPAQSQQTTGLFGNTSNAPNSGTGLFGSSGTSKIKLIK